MKFDLRSFINRMFYALLIPLVSYIHFSLNVYREGVRNIKIGIDDLIPMVNIFVIPYFYWFAYVFISVVFFAAVNGRYFFRMLMSIVFGMLTCFIFFIYFPTTVPRPEILTQDFISQMVKHIYSTDNPYNCFPSIHVLNAVIVSLFLSSFARKNIWNISRTWAYVIFYISLLSGISISLSTVFIKQHHILDVVGGALIAWMYYLIFTSDKFINWSIIKGLRDKLLPEAVKRSPDLL